MTVTLVINISWRSKWTKTLVLCTHQVKTKEIEDDVRLRKRNGKRPRKMGASSNEWQSVLYTIWWSWTFLFRMTFAWTHWKKLVSETGFHINCFILNVLVMIWLCMSLSILYPLLYQITYIWNCWKTWIFLVLDLFFFELADLSPHSMFEHSKKTYS